MDLLVSASTGALQAVLPELAKLLGDEYNLQTSVKEGIQWLHAELETMQSTLEMLSEMSADKINPQIKLWASNMRDMSYVIQDTVDSYIVHVEAAAGESGSSRTCCVNVKGILPWTCMARHDIATEIERIKKEVEEMSRRRVSYNVDALATAVKDKKNHDPRSLAPFVGKEKLVGIDRSREEIINKLSPFMSNKEGGATTEQNLKLVSIVGPAGMSKTTLAHVTYEQLQEKFDCTAFVSVSLRPDIKDILSEILRELTRNIKVGPKEKDKDTENDKHKSQKQDEYNTAWSQDEVIRRIRQVLEKRRYLIVIDDIWDAEAWNHIKCVLLENKLGSKVITTTRNMAVANSCCSPNEVDGTIHELKRLSDDDSKQLFCSKIFGNDKCPAELLAVSRKILEKCEGWPLGITAIASLLANKPTQTKDQWLSVYNSISTGLGNDDNGVKDMRLILSLSYRDMPSKLRACLLYLSIFPEDHIIGRDDLIRRWIAEEIVHGYELGDEYFNELIQRSMVQPIDVDAFGRAQACKVHDLVLEFVTSLSAEQNFVTVFDGRKAFKKTKLDRIYRLSLRNLKGEHCIPQGTKRLPHVRTLVVSSRAISSMPSLSIFPLLRVLELERCTTSDIKSVGRLNHLRYLRLSQYYGYCIKLPEAIGTLPLLQTLDLKDAWIEELPSTVVQLRKVKVLEISLRKWDKICEGRLVRCMCNLEQLEVLYIFAPDLSLDLMFQVDWAPTHIQRFTACARKKTQHIFMRGSVWAELSSFSTLPRWINSSCCSCLSDLAIMVGTLRQTDVDILAALPKLLSVDLEVVEVEVEATRRRLEVNGRVRTSTGQATAFPCLGNFKFSSRAVGLVFRQGAMQKLQKLYLCFDIAQTKEVYGDLDLGLENLSSLKAVKVEMDCRCARLVWVEAAEASLYKATIWNPPNCPTLDLKRYFQEEMLSGEEEEISEELRANKEKDVLLSKLGPFGGKGGSHRDIGVAPHRLKNVTICSGDIVDSLTFSYTDQDGKQRSGGPWGGHGGKVSTINLGPSEYLMKVSGTTGPFYGVAKGVTSLTFVTNAASYGPFGKGGGDPFDALPAHNDSGIVGFFGRAGGSLDAIGFYVRPQ